MIADADFADVHLPPLLRYGKRKQMEKLSCYEVAFPEEMDVKDVLQLLLTHTQILIVVSIDHILKRCRSRSHFSHSTSRANSNMPNINTVSLRMPGTLRCPTTYAKGAPSKSLHNPLKDKHPVSNTHTIELSKLNRGDYPQER